MTWPKMTSSTSDAREVGPGEEFPGRVARQGHRRDILEDRAALREGCPHAGHDGSPPSGWDRQHIIVQREG